MNTSAKLSAPLRGAEHYNQIDASANVRKTLDTTFILHLRFVHGNEVDFFVERRFRRPQTNQA